MVYRLDRPDHSSETGARALARSIAEHWKAKGHEVQIEIVPVTYLNRKGQQETIHSVRTDLRAGFPRATR